jgi:hypothetical protein
MDMKKGVVSLVDYSWDEARHDRRVSGVLG